MLIMTKKLTKNRTQWSALGTALGIARELGGLTQQRAADALGISRGQLLAIEYGERQPRPDELRAMIALYAVDERGRELDLDTILGNLDTADLAVVYDFARLLLVERRVQQANARRRGSLASPVESQPAPSLAE